MTLRWMPRIRMGWFIEQPQTMTLPPVRRLYYAFCVYYTLEVKCVCSR